MVSRPSSTPTSAATSCRGPGRQHQEHARRAAGPRPGAARSAAGVEPVELVRRDQGEPDSRTATAARPSTPDRGPTDVAAARSVPRGRGAPPDRASGDRPSADAGAASSAPRPRGRTTRRAGPARRPSAATVTGVRQRRRPPRPSARCPGSPRRPCPSSAAAPAAQPRQQPAGRDERRSGPRRSPAPTRRAERATYDAQHQDQERVDLHVEARAERRGGAGAPGHPAVDRVEHQRDGGQRRPGTATCTGRPNESATSAATPPTSTARASVTRSAGPSRAPAVRGAQPSAQSSATSTSRRRPTPTTQPAAPSPTVAGERGEQRELRRPARIAGAGSNRTHRASVSMGVQPSVRDPRRSRFEFRHRGRRRASAR